MTSIASIISKDIPIKSPSSYSNFDKALHTFLKYVGLQKVFEKEVERFSPLVKSLDILNIPTFVGLEIEVENIHQELPLPEFWKEKTDHSLRDGGKEYTTVPLSPEQSIIAIIVLWLFMTKLTQKKKPEFSWRTSDHVHLNVLDLNEDEFRSLLLLGVLFEPVFFEFAGKDRQDSVFCVPLSQSTVRNNLSSYLRKKESLKVIATKWPKYTALNLCRLYSFPFPAEPGSNVCPALGTLEFRHLGGTPDPTTLIEWLAMILRLFRAVIGQTPTDILEKVSSLTTSQAYHTFTKQTLGVTTQIQDTLASVALVKDLFLGPPKLGVIRPRSALNSFLVAQGKKKVIVPKTKDVKTFTVADFQQAGGVMFTTTTLSDTEF